GYEPAMVLDLNAPCQTLDFAPQGDRIIFTSFNLRAHGTKITLWNLKSGRAFKLYDGNGFFPSSFSFSPDGKYVAGVRGDNNDHTLFVWECETGKTKSTYHGFYYVLWYKDKLCAVGESRKKLVTPDTKEVVYSLPDNEPGDNHFLLIRGSVLQNAPAQEGGQMWVERNKVIDPNDGSLLGEFPGLHHDYTYFSRDGKFAAFRDAVGPGRTVFQLVRISSDGRKDVLASNWPSGGLSADGKLILVQAPWVQLVDVQEGKALWHWPGRMGRLSPDGQSVVVETSTTDLWKDDRAIRLYRLPPHKPWLSIIFWPLFIGLLVY